MTRLGLTSLLAATLAWSPRATASPWAPTLEVGLSLGLPAGINTGLGLWAGRLGVRAWGCYLGPAIHGVQLGAGFDFAGERTSNAVMLIVGYSRLTFGEWAYGGVAYDLRTDLGFFFELGMTVGYGSFSSPQLHLQLGYLWHTDLY